jgi:lipoic acid synthetase/lipoate-protein ligase A
MTIVQYPEGLSLADYLQIEQELVKSVAQPTFFTWIVSPTVIYGHHQHAEAELNEVFCREQGIAVVQRKSGGGCVYADRGNLMISYIEPSAFSRQHADLDPFRRFLNKVAEVLQSAGLPAVTTEHNDILIDGRKVSGWACFRAPTGTIIHGTMLYDVDIETMMKAITPSSRKLTKHGVASVRQRVVNIRELTDRFASIEDLRSYVTEHLAARKDD